MMSAIKLVEKECADVLSKSHHLLAELKNQKLLVTGGTGFMGTWLAETVAFLNDNYGFATRLVLLADNAHNFGAKAAHLATRKDLQLIEKDVRNIMELPGDVSYIVHAAGNPDSRQHASDPLKAMDVIARGTRAVLESASRLGDIKKILVVSSGQVYGAQPCDLERIPETYHGGPDCDSLLSVYPEAKRFAETISTAYRSQLRLPIVIVRPFAFVGPYQLLDKPWAINNFLYDSLNGGPIRILGNQNTVRSYMYASDMAVWLLRMLVAGNVGSAYNLGSPQGISLGRLAEKIAGQFTNKVDIVSDVPPNSNANRSRFVPSTTLAETALELTHTVAIDEALQKTIAWHRETGATGRRSRQ